MRPSLRQVLFRSAGLDLNFAGGVFSLNNTRTASPAAIPGWSFSRTDTNGTATALDLAGNVIQFATGVPRITNRGILVEEARTNVLLNSATLSTQSVTTTAVAHTLSFYGTGTVTLTGTSTAGPLVGTGASNRVTLTFTPTAGTLTLTVTGSVTTAQLEAGAFATSPIITTGAAGTRGADTSTMGSFVFPAAHTFVVETQAPVLQTGLFPTSFSSTGTNVGLLVTGSTNVSGANMGNATFNDVYGSAVSAGGTIKNAFRAETNNARGCLNGTLSALDATFTPVVGSQTLNIGAANGSTSYWNSYVQRIRILPTALPDAQLQALTAP
jgi:hypothetical protein